MRDDFDPVTSLRPLNHRPTRLCEPTCKRGSGHIQHKLVFFFLHNREKGVEGTTESSSVMLERFFKMQMEKEGERA